MLKYISAIIGLLLANNVFAQTVSYGESNFTTALEEYFAANPENNNKSIIYVFFNNSECYECPQTIQLIENVYNQNYQNQYSMFLINYQDDYNSDFIAAYELSQPLSVVLVRINDGAAFGYEKIDGLQNMMSDPVSMEEYIQNRIDNFLGNGD